MNEIVSLGEVKKVYCDGQFVAMCDAKINVNGSWYPYDTDTETVIDDNGEALPIGGKGVVLAPIF